MSFRTPRDSQENGRKCGILIDFINPAFVLSVDSVWSVLASNRERKTHEHTYRMLERLTSLAIRVGERRETNP